jgi:thiamine biosynthesis lipoprotein
LLRDLEAHWSRFLHDSDVTRLNHAAGIAVSVDPSTVTLVATMVDAWRSTDGAFDPSILPALIESGYRTSIDDPYRVTFLPDGRLAVGGYDSGPTMDDIAIDPDRSTITLPSGLVIDPGGIGKGLAADLAVHRLLSLGAGGALVSIGGDMAMAGTPPHDADGWTVALAHPEPALGNLCTLLVGAGGVATSSTRSRRWIHEGRERHHQIDPRRAEQSSTDLATVTVVGRSGWLAEAHATAALLSGTQDVIGYLDDHELSGIAVALDGNVLATADLRTHQSLFDAGAVAR